ncbi:MAG: hypothetical protein L0229_15685 [Blastocatellia bacterium]|nr:hypothetical protein [Blastocatellia bacterium]
MTEQEMQEIYNRLLDLTKAGRVKWKKTGGFDKAKGYEYTLSFSRSSVIIEKSYDYLPPLTVLKIYNQDGLPIAIASDDSGEVTDEVILEDPVEVFSIDPSELFDLVQSQVYKYSETTTNILDELRKLESNFSERRESN